MNLAVCHVCHRVYLACDVIDMRCRHCSALAPLVVTQETHVRRCHRCKGLWRESEMRDDLCYLCAREESQCQQIS